MGYRPRALEDLALSEPSDTDSAVEGEPTKALPTAGAGRVLRNMSILVAGQGLALPVVFATSVLLVRSLGNEGFGQYAFVYAYLGLYVWLASFGLENIVVRETSKRPENAGEIWGSAVGVAAFWSFISLGLAFGVAAISGYSKATLAMLVIGSVEIIALVPPRMTVVSFQVHLVQYKGVATNLGRQILWLIAVYLLTRRGASLTTLIAWRLAIAVLETGVTVWLAKGLLGRPFRVTKSEVRYLLKQGWPLALTYLSIGVYHRIDRVLLERFVGPGELGYYAAADNILTFFGVAPLAFMMSVFPILCRRVDDRPGFDRIAANSYRLVLFLIIGACGTMFGVSHILVTTLYGAEFASTASLMNVLVIAQIAVAYGTVLSQVLIARSLQRLITVTTAVGAVVNVGVNLLVLPRYGAMGAAWVTVVSYWLAGALIFHIFPSARHDSAIGLKVLALVTAVGAVAFIPLQVIFRQNLAATAGAAVLFVIASLLTGVIRRSDFALVRRALRKKSDGGEGPSPDALAEEETLAEVSRLETT